MPYEKGQSLIEVIIAATIGILVVAALTFATIFSLRNASFARNSVQATKLAQEGIERVRTGRDRNSSVTVSPPTLVRSWDGDGSPGSAIWDYQITGIGKCDDPSLGKCYFKVDSTGALTYIGYAAASFPVSFAEGIPTANPVFKRVVLLSDDSIYATRKTVTIVVQWTDLSGIHESKLTTILRKL